MYQNVYPIIKCIHILGGKIFNKMFENIFIFVYLIIKIIIFKIYK